MTSDWLSEQRYVDFKQRDGGWQVGIVMLKAAEYLKLRCDGWSSRYDEIMYLNEIGTGRNSRIHPFRSVIRGYTGMQKTPGLREHWKYTNEGHEVRLTKLDKTLTTLHEKSPYEIVQYVRGEHYFYVDFLLGGTYTTTLDLVKVYQYFRKHVQMTKIWLQHALRVGLSEWLGTEGDSWEAAFSQSYYQLFDSLYAMAGLYDRLKGFVTHNAKLIKEVTDYHETHENYIANEFAQQISDAGKQLIRMAHQVVTNQPTKQLPFPFVYALMSFFLSLQKCIQLYDKQETQQLLPLMNQILKVTVGQLKPNDLTHPQIDVELNNLFIRTWKLLCKHGQENILGAWIDPSKVRIGMVLINCDKMERKLKGISKLKEQNQHMTGHSQEESRRIFAEQLTNGCFFERIFEENQHPQVFKKGVQLVVALYRNRRVSMKQLCDIWQRAMGKQDAIIKLMHRFWIELSTGMHAEDVTAYFNTPAQLYQSSQPTRDELTFCFDFTLAAVRFHSRLKHQRQAQPELEDRVSQLLRDTFRLLASSHEQVQGSVEAFSRAVMYSSHSDTIVEELYHNLTQRKDFRVTLLVLKEVHDPIKKNQKVLSVFNKQASVLLDCLTSPQLTQIEVQLVIKLIDEAMSESYRMRLPCPLTPQKLKQIWVYFRHAPQASRAAFHEWVLNPGYYSSDRASFNQYFPTELRAYALDHILGDSQVTDYSQLCRKQLEIAIELFISRNIIHNKLEKKIYYTGSRTFFRLRETELLKQDLLWNIFQNCKNHEVIALLSKNLIAFHFHFASSLSNHSRNTRVEQLMRRVIRYITTSYQQGNTRLLKHSLMLLKWILDLVKEERVHISSERAATAMTAKLKIHIYYEKKCMPVDAAYEQPVGYFKVRVAQLLGCPPCMLKMVNTRREEVMYEVRDLPLSCLSDRAFTVVPATSVQETMAGLVFSYLQKDIEDILITMLEIEAVTSEVYGVLEEIELQADTRGVLERIGSILDKYSVAERISKFGIYYGMLQVKLYNKIAQNHQNIVFNKAFDQLVQSLTAEIRFTSQVLFLQKINTLLFRLAKSDKRQGLETVKLPERCFAHMLAIVEYACKHKIDNLRIKECLQKSFQASSLLVEEFAPRGALEFYLSKPIFLELLQKLYLSHQIEEARSFITDHLMRYIAQTGKIASQSLASLFIEGLYPNLGQAQPRYINKGLSEFYSILTAVITHLSPQSFAQYITDESKGPSFYHKVIQMLHNCKSQDNILSTHILAGHFHILAAIYQACPKIISSEIIRFILEDCLGLSPRPIDRPICQTPYSTKSAFSVLQRILDVTVQPQIVLQIMESLDHCQKVHLWRDCNSWNIVPVTEVKQAYRGLNNPGCICYMNSLLQQLYTIKEFRESVLALRASEQEDDPDEIQWQIQLLSRLKSLFLSLEHSQQNVVSPIQLVKTIRGADRRPLIRINEQMDIDEFAAILFDRVQGGLSKLGANNVVRQLFGGTFAHQVISQECKHRSEREEEFLSISLDVKRTLEQGFAALTHVQVLDGQNKYFCEKCDKKVRAKKAQTLRKTPPFLVIALKRFEYNYDLDAKIKINDYCEFPHELDLKSFSCFGPQQGQVESGQDTLEKEGKQPDPSFGYKLRGVVVHSGSADSGHYYSFIQAQEGEWFEFNDDQVMPFDPQRLPDQSYGSRQGYQQCRIRNAYLLIYQKTTKDTPETPQMPEENDSIIAAIRQRNRDARKQELVFCDKFESLIKKSSHCCDRLQMNPGRWHRMFLSYFFLVRMRRDGFEDFVRLCEQAQKAYSHYPDQKLFLIPFTSCKFLEEFFVYSPQRDRCRILAHLFLSILQAATTVEQKTLPDNPLFLDIFKAFTLVFELHTVVPQLMTIIRKYFDFLLESDMQQFMMYIVQNNNLQNVLVSYVFDIPLVSGSDQALRENYNKHSIDYLEPKQFSSRVYIMRHLTDSWRVLALIEQQRPRKMQGEHQISSINVNKLTTAISETNSERGLTWMLAYAKMAGIQMRMLNSVEIALKSYQSYRYRPYMLMMYCLLRDPQVPSAIIIRIIEVLQKGYKQNNSFFLEVDMLNQWMYKYAETNSEFAKALHQRSQFLKGVYESILKVSIPLADHLKKHKNPSNEKLLNRYHGITVSSSPQDYNIRYYQLKRQYRQLVQGRLIEIEPVRQCKQSYEPDTNIEYFDSTMFRWRRGTITQNKYSYVEVLPDRITLKQYFWEDSERLRMADEHSVVEEESNSSDVSASESLSHI